jgi:hypothetical protein
VGALPEVEADPDCGFPATAIRSEYAERSVGTTADKPRFVVLSLTVQSQQPSGVKGGFTMAVFAKTAKVLSKGYGRSRSTKSVGIGQQRPDCSRLSRHDQTAGQRLPRPEDRHNQQGEGRAMSRKSRRRPGRMIALLFFCALLSGTVGSAAVASGARMRSCGTVPRMAPNQGGGSHRAFIGVRERLQFQLWRQS